MTITRVARAAGMTAAMAGAFVAVGPAQAVLAAPGTNLNVGEKDLTQAAAGDDVWIQYCREITALTVGVYWGSTGSNVKDVIERGDQVDVIGQSGSRFHVNYKEDGEQRSGWITTDARYVRACD